MQIVGRSKASAGVRRRTLDHVSDYLPLRRQTYDIELAPLPDNLELSSHDEELNRHAKLKIVPERAPAAPPG